MSKRTITDDELFVLSEALVNRSEQLKRAHNTEKDPEVKSIRLRHKHVVDNLLKDIVNLDIFGSAK